MDNKMTEFIREFNGNLSELEQFNNLEYATNGFYEAISLPAVNLFDSENYTCDHFKKITLSNLLKVISDLGEVAGNMFADEIWAWEKETEIKIKEKFPNSKIKVKRLGTLRYKIILSGKYSEEGMSDFIEVVTQDFQYMFDGCKLDYEY